MVTLADFGGPQFNPNARGAQQGTLFSNRRLNAANRTGDEVGHKGFSPNRLAAVRDAVNVASTEVFTGTRGHKVFSDMEAAGHSSYDRSVAAVGLNADDVHQTIARSTVPVDALRSQPYVGSTVRRPLQITVGADWARTAAYDPMSQQVGLNNQSVATGALIHEIGHHADFNAHHDGTPGGLSGAAIPSEMGNPTMLARTEGFADAYEDVHFRPHPRNSMGVKSPESGYPRLSDSEWEERTQGHYNPQSAFSSPSADYARVRAEHGGQDMRPPPWQQLQFASYALKEHGDPSWAMANAARPSPTPR